jgi:molybdenum cofactor biosynthesis protein B
MAHTYSDQAIALNIAVLTVSDSRTEATDTSGQLLVERLTDAGHHLSEKRILADEKYRIRAQVAHWAADDRTQVVLITGGTGFTERDATPEAVAPLFDKEVQGFGELFRQLSYDEIGSSTVQSRALAGFSNDMLIFCLPGSRNACRTAWDRIIGEQLDSQHRPCNFVLRLKPVTEN